MNIYDVQYTDESSGATTRFAQYCPTGTDLGAWLKRIVLLLMDTTSNKFEIPGTSQVVDISNPQSILIATST